jgi:single-stranded-DNA-specific exonuclease
VERYGVPVFIGTYEDEAPDQLRGSARGIPEFDVYAALKYCHDLLGKYGGHHAAGGFSLPAANLDLFQAKLTDFAHQYLEPSHLQPMITVDGQADFAALNEQLFQQINHLHPCGIGNNEPIFWTPNVRVLEQQNMGKDHGKFTLAQDGSEKILRAIAWRWREYLPLPYRLDIAYKLRENTWNGKTTIELELVGVRLPSLPPRANPQQEATFLYHDQSYSCTLWDSLSELRIKDPQGKTLIVQKGQRQGLWGLHRDNAVTIDVTKPPYYHLVKAAVQALET